MKWEIDVLLILGSPHWSRELLHYLHHFWSCPNCVGLKVVFSWCRHLGGLHLEDCPVVNLWLESQVCLIEMFGMRDLEATISVGLYPATSHLLSSGLGTLHPGYEVDRRPEARGQSTALVVMLGAEEGKGRWEELGSPAWACLFQVEAPSWIPRMSRRWKHHV